MHKVSYDNDAHTLYCSPRRHTRRRSDTSFSFRRVTILRARRSTLHGRGRKTFRVRFFNETRRFFFLIGRCHVFMNVDTIRLTSITSADVVQNVLIQLHFRSFERLEVDMRMYFNSNRFLTRERGFGSPDDGVWPHDALGVAGYCVGGSNGEGPYLNADEKLEMVSKIRSMIAADRSLIAGTTCECNGVFLWARTATVFLILLIFSSH